MEKIKNKYNFLKYLTLSFLFLFPLSGLTFFHNHITNLIIVIFISLIFLLTICFYKESRKNIKYLFFYVFLCFLYLIINYFRSKNFVSLIPNEYSFFSEMLTVIKLVVPVFFLYSLYYQRLKKNEYLFIIKSWIIMIAGSIVITNIFKVSLSSYKYIYITKNIFEWNKNISCVLTASKGFFTFANQISSILLILLIVCIYFCLYDKKRNIIYLIILCLAMLMVGTRVAALGGLLTLICCILFYVVICFFKHKKVSKNLFLFILPVGLWMLLLPISPFASRNIELNTYVEAEEKKFNEILDEETEVKKFEKQIKEENNDVKSDPKIEYVYNNRNPNYLADMFLENYYPIENDSDFWYVFVKNTPKEKINYRYIEISIVKRMIEVNDNGFDNFFGISNSRIQNVMNVESDFLLHYYSFGLVGSLILLIFYIFLLVYSFINFVKKQDYFCFISLTIVSLFVFSAFLTGNVINSLFTNVAFTYIISLIFLDNNGKKVANE